MQRPHGVANKQPKLIIFIHIKFIYAHLSWKIAVYAPLQLFINYCKKTIELQFKSHVLFLFVKIFFSRLFYLFSQTEGAVL